MAQKILIIEDEPSIADNIVFSLKKEGFEPIWCKTGHEGKEALTGDISAVILDIGLPDTNGFDLCREIRKFSDVPILFLTARSDEIDRIVGLEIGGDDYVVKPFSPRELTARVKVILRRTTTIPVVPAAQEEEQETVFRIDEAQRIIFYQGKPLSLSRYENEVLKLLVEHPGRVYNRAELMQAVWDEPEMSLDRTVDAHIKAIRSKLKSVDPETDPIETRRGFGYTLRK